MNENPAVKKKDMPLAMLLLAAHIVINYRKVLGLFTNALTFSGVTGILQFLVNVSTAVVPIIMLVLLFLHITKDRPATASISVLCFIMGAAFLINLGLILYQHIFLILMGVQVDFYELFLQIGSIGALLVYGIGMLQIGSKLRKDKLRVNLRSYGLLFYALLFVVVLFVAMPAFMDITVTLSIGNLLNYALFMAAGFFLPATLLEDGEKSRPVNVVNFAVTIVLAATIYGMGSTIGFSSYSDRHSMPEVTTVSCPVCHKQYTDNGNKRSIQRKNMCKSCSIGYEATKDALGW